MTMEQKDLAETIAKANGGCVIFNLTKAAQIAGRSRNGFPAWLHDHGTMVQKISKGKYVNVNDLTAAMINGWESPF